MCHYYIKEAKVYNCIFISNLNLMLLELRQIDAFLQSIDSGEWFMLLTYIAHKDFGFALLVYLLYHL